MIANDKKDTFSFGFGVYVDREHVKQFIASENVILMALSRHQHVRVKLHAKNQKSEKKHLNFCGKDHSAGTHLFDGKATRGMIDLERPESVSGFPKRKK